MTFTLVSIWQKRLFLQVWLCDMITCDFVAWFCTWFCTCISVSWFCNLIYRPVKLDSFVCVAWLVQMCDRTHLYATRLIYTWHMTDIYAAWLIHSCDRTHSYMWQDSFKCVIWLIHLCAMTLSCVCHDLFMYVPWLIHMCAVTRAYVWHDRESFANNHIIPRSLLQKRPMHHLQTSTIQ